MSDAKTVHVTIAGSAAGNVREVIKGRGLHKLVVVEDWFSVGPLLDISEPGGLEARKACLRNLFDKIQEGSMHQEIERHVGIRDIQRISPDAAEIVVWCGANADEQILLRAVCSIWQNNPIRVVDVGNIHPDYENRSAIGGCTVDELVLAEASATFLSSVAAEKLATRWQALVKDSHLLRVFVDGDVMGVDETYFDPMLIDFCSNDFVAAARLVGTVMSRSSVFIGDAFLNYRLRELIANGVIESPNAETKLPFMQVRRRLEA